MTVEIDKQVRCHSADIFSWTTGFNRERSRAA